MVIRGDTSNRIGRGLMPRPTMMAMIRLRLVVAAYTAISELTEELQLYDQLVSNSAFGLPPLPLPCSNLRADGVAPPSA
jgi:hypothetical protein